MENLKVKVSTAQESKDAQELFFELGYSWNGNTDVQDLSFPVNNQYWLCTKKIGMFYSIKWGTGHDAGKLITLPQLRDMVVLKRNDVSDSNFKLFISPSQGYLNLYKDSNDTFYAYCTKSKTWDKSKSVSLKTKNLEPIEKPMKQTLNGAEVALQEMKADPVNHPSHYTGHPSGIECIEITRHHDFAIGNAIKYLWRAGLKDSDNEIQDLKKAVWYIQDKINQLENNP